MEQSTPQATDHADIRVPPPVFFLVALLLGIVLDFVAPLTLIPNAVAVPLGLVLLAGGVAVFAWALRTMFGAGEHPEPNTPTHKVLTHGPYRFTRNPIYLGMTLAGLGISIALNAIWGVPLVLIAAVVVDRTAIVPEERYLETKFGDEYRQYLRDVRRWV